MPIIIPGYAEAMADFDIEFAFDTEVEDVNIIDISEQDIIDFQTRQSSVRRVSIKNNFGVASRRRSSTISNNEESRKSSIRMSTVKGGRRLTVSSNGNTEQWEQRPSIADQREPNEQRLTVAERIVNHQRQSKFHALDVGITEDESQPNNLGQENSVSSKDSQNNIGSRENSIKLLQKEGSFRKENSLSQIENYKQIITWPIDEDFKETKQENNAAYGNRNSLKNSSRDTSKTQRTSKKYLTNSILQNRPTDARESILVESYKRSKLPLLETSNPISRSKKIQACLKDEKYLVTSCPQPPISLNLSQPPLPGLGSPPENLFKCKDVIPITDSDTIGADFDIQAAQTEYQTDVNRKYKGIVKMEYTALKNLHAQCAALATSLRMRFDYYDENVVEESEVSKVIDYSKVEESKGEMWESEWDGGALVLRVEDAVIGNGEGLPSLGCRGVAEYMRHAVKAVGLFGKVGKCFLRKWGVYLDGREMERVVVGCFWYTWCMLFGGKDCQSDVLSGLLRRISAVYVKLFATFNTIEKDFFFQELPDLISRALVHIYEEAFPESIAQFDKKFQASICSLIFTQLSGIDPSFTPSTKWGTDAQKVSVKLTKAQDQQLQKRKALMNVLTSSNKFDEPVVLDEVVDKETPPVVGGTTEAKSFIFQDTRRSGISKFSLYQNSPLIKKYLQAGKEEGKLSGRRVLVRRTEVCKDNPPVGAKTYHDLVVESAVESKRNFADFYAHIF